jgi:DNA-binding NarL/FixJ family response regulator
MVRVAGNSSEAIHELKKFADDPLTSRPLVILALSSKNGESAVETCRLLHEIDPEIKVIAMSGTILDPIMENYRDYGFINTLPKPFSMDNLKHIINTVIHT